MSYDIPRPTGPYPVASIDVLDKTGADSCRFRMYYPTVAEKGSTWMERGSLHAFATQLTGGGFCSRIMKCYFENTKMPVWKGGPLHKPQTGSGLPVVLVSHGLMMSKLQYSYLSSEIASHGYFVAALDHRDGSSAESEYVDTTDNALKLVPYDSNFDMKNPVIEEGRFAQVEQRRKDMSYLMDCVENLNSGELKNILDCDADLGQFADRLDTDKCAIVGHSYGGATVVASLTDPRFKAAVSMDGWMGVLKEEYLANDCKTPLLFINCVGHIKPSDRIKMDRVIGDLHTRTMVTLLGSTHLTHTDFAYFPKSRWLSKVIFKSVTDPKLANDVSSEIMMEFIARHLGLPYTRDVKDVVAARSGLAIMGSDLSSAGDAEQLATECK